MAPCPIARRAACAAASFVVVSLAATSAGAQASSPAPIAAQAMQRYDVPAEALNLALARFATLSGVDLLYDHALAAGRTSSTLAGTYTPQQAILLLLRGTGLAVRFTSRTAAVVFLPDQPAATPAEAKPSGKTLDLDALRVTASPLIGSPSGVFDAYGRQAQGEIYRRLAADPALNGVVFRIELRVDLDGEGVIRNAHLMTGAGDSRLDSKILALVDGARLSQPPPPGLPQPLRFRIVSR